MRILVAGGQGQVGRALATLGAERDLDIVALGRTELDITDAGSIKAAFDRYKPGVLINAAAYTAVDRAETEPDLVFAINETGVKLLADACAVANIPMLHISTDYVFDGLKKGFYDECDPVKPGAVYGRSKEAGECALRKRLEHHIILRTSWVFGDQGNSFVKTIVRLAQSQDCIRVVDDEIGGPSSAKSIAKALVGLAGRYQTQDQIPWGTYHFCQKPYVSRYQFAKKIIKHSAELGLLDRKVEIKAISSSDFNSIVARPPNTKLLTKKYERYTLQVKNDWQEDLIEVLRSFK